MSIYFYRYLFTERRRDQRQERVRRQFLSRGTLLHRSYIYRNPKKDFRSLTLFWEDNPHTAILRMTGESANWYEVEVNEQTKATKYVLKNEPMMWAKITWEYWLYRVGALMLSTLVINASCRATSRTEK